MVVKLTLKNGQVIWVNMMHLAALYGSVEGGSIVVLASDAGVFDITETPNEFWDRLQGRGGVAVPQKSAIITG